MFKNCRIIAVNANPDEYHTVESGCERGTPKFVMFSSAIRAFWAAPSKWREPIIDEEGNVTFWEFPGSVSTEYGALFDCLLLTPENFKDRYVVPPEEYVNAKKEVNKWSWNATFCKQWRADREEEGLEVTTQKMVWKAQQAIKRFLRDHDFARIVEQSEKQVWIVGEWHDPSGIVVPCKCLIDLCPRLDSDFHKSIADVKTTKNARPIAWEKWAHSAGYEVQAAWNNDMFVAATNREICSFRFLLSENEAPYEIGRRLMSVDIIEPDRDQGDVASGRRQYKRMMADYCACWRTGRVPGSDDPDESANGWTIVAPNPYAEQARAFSPKFSFAEEEEDGGEPEETNPDVIG